MAEGEINRYWFQLKEKDNQENRENYGKLIENTVNSNFQQKQQNIDKMSLSKIHQISCVSVIFARLFARLFVV